MVDEKLRIAIFHILESTLLPTFQYTVVVSKLTMPTSFTNEQRQNTANSLTLCKL